MSALASAHSPITSETDNDSIDRCVVVNDPLKSWAIYSELQKGATAHYYKMELNDGDKLQLILFIPVTEKDNFLPSLLIMGEGIEPNGSAPTYVEIPDGYKVKAMPGILPDRPDYEPFTPSSAYYLVEEEVVVNATGTYYVVVHEPTHGGKYGLAIGYKELWGPGEWLMVPINAVKIHVWEGQPWFLVLSPVLVSVVLGTVVIGTKGRGYFSHLPSWPGIPAGLIMFGSGMMTLLQMVYALRLTTVSGMVLITLAFGFVQTSLGTAILWTLLRNQDGLGIKSRVLVFACGIFGLMVWGGLIIGPVLAMVAALLPFREALSSGARPAQPQQCPPVAPPSKARYGKRRGVKKDK